MDIFSKVSGLFYTVFAVQTFFLSSFLTYYATKYLVDDLYGSFPKNEQYYGYKHHEMWKSWDAPNTPTSHAGYEGKGHPKPGQGHDKHSSRLGR